MDVALSDVERKYITDGVKQDHRSDGRRCFDYRHIDLEMDVISNCSGSGHVRLGNCEVLAGIKCELVEPDNEEPGLGIVEFFADLSPNASPLYEELNEMINNYLVSSLNNSIPDCMNLKELCIINGKFVWKLFVDILILEIGSKPNLFDATSIAVKAALFDTRIPKVSVDENEDIEVSDDPFNVQRIDVSRIPLFLTVTRIGNHYIVDATQEEEASSLSSILVAITPDGEIIHTKKMGIGSIHPDPYKEHLNKIKEFAISLHNDLNVKLAEEYKIMDNSNKIAFLV